jgi:hypothetical protein
MEKDNLRLNFEGFLKTQGLGDDAILSKIENFDFSSSGSAEVELPEMQSNLLLGKRAERFFAAWIECSEDYKMVSENIQIFEEKRTLGELDFIINRVADNQLIHVELVYKYYLFDESIIGSEFEKWTGPNRKDNLALKVSKLEEKQFTLLYSLAARNKLSALGLNVDQLTQQVLFLGNLFLPASLKIDHTLNPDAIQGYWYTTDEFTKLHKAGDCYCLPAKKDWFMHSPPEISWISWDDFDLKLAKSLEMGRSPMVWKLQADGTFERAFVVWWPSIN